MYGEGLFAESILVAYILNMELEQEESGDASSIGVDRSVWLVWLVGIVAICDAFRLRWLSDDAFISFRYARNLVDGKGLVFNAGEYVEGYTNLLWTLLMAGGMVLGCEPEIFSHVLSLACYAGTLYVLARMEKPSVLPIAMFIVAGMFHMRVFATSGLETMLFVLLVSLVTSGVWKGQHRKVSIASVLAILTRPEGGLLWLTAALSLRDNSKKRIVLMTGAITLTALSLWRWIYYGELLPNTYYAKASEANWEQGVLYISIFFGMYWFLLLVFPALILLRKERENEYRLLLFSTSFLVLYTLHVMRAGGDFMVARFCLPWVPVLSICIALFLNKRFSWKGIAIGVGILAVTAIYPQDLLRNEGGKFGIKGITEERHWYPEEWRAKAEQQGKAMRHYFADSKASVVIYGAQAMFAYYAQLPYVVEGMSGLTDAELARRAIRADRVGHGRKADVAYLQSRGIDLYLDFRISQPASPLNEIDFGGFKGAILSYRSEVLQELREKGASFTDFDGFLSNYLSAIHRMEFSQVERDYKTFHSYYFQHNEDPREQIFIEYLGAQ